MHLANQLYLLFFDLNDYPLHLALGIFMTVLTSRS